MDVHRDDELDSEASNCDHAAQTDSGSETGGPQRTLRKRRKPEVSRGE